MKKSYTLLFLLFITLLANAQKTWVGGTTGNWNTGSNWSGGTVPTNTDDVQFNVSSGTTVTLDFTTSTIINSLTIGGTANITFTTDANRTINLGGAGTSGTALSIAASRSLTLNATVSSVGIVIAIPTNYVASINGGLTLSVASATATGQINQLSAVDANSVQVNSGGSILVNNRNTGYPIASPNSNNNVVIFNSGSSFTSYAGSGPWGNTTPPNGFAQFNSGSTFNVFSGTGSFNPSLGGRTLGNLVISSGTTLTNAFNATSVTTTIENLTVNSGTLVFYGTGTASPTYSLGNIKIGQTGSAGTLSLRSDGSTNSTLNTSYSISGDILIGGTTGTATSTLNLGTVTGSGTTGPNTTTFTFTGAGKSISNGTAGTNLLVQTNTSGSYTTNYVVAANASLAINRDFTLSTSATNSNFTVNPLGVLTVGTGATLTTNAKLTLASDATGSGSIGNSAGTISGNVTVQRYIAGGGLSTALPSKRAYRFLAHPFSGSLNLSDITGTGEIDITGTGGAGNGFTATTNNNPSAFKYDAASATSNTGAGLQAGWIAYTSANGTTGNTWDRYKGLRVFYRGAKGEGLSGSTYTVGNATITMSGALNTGNQTINLDYNSGASTGFNLVSNPYASNVDMTAVTGGRLVNVASAYYVWNIGLGNRGAYSTQTFGSAYVLPAYASFFVSATAAAGSITFNESDKTASAATQTLLRTTTANKLKLQLKSDNILWDEFELEFGSKYKAATEYEDAAKLANPDVSLYSVSASNDMLAIDRRAALKEGESVTLGLDATTARSYTIEVADNTIANQELYLIDKYTNQTQKLEAGAVYSFTTDANAASQGVGRFTIVAKNVLPSLTLTNGFTVTVGPNPTNRGVVTVSFTNEEALETFIKITDVQGKTVQVINAGKVSIGNVKVNTASLQAGTYFITLNNGKQTKTKQLLVQ